jgi:hypothetical protein
LAPLPVLVAVLDNGARMPPELIPGLPDDLARVLRDPSIIVPQDQHVFQTIAEGYAGLRPEIHGFAGLPAHLQANIARNTA